MKIRLIVSLIFSFYVFYSPLSLSALTSSSNKIQDIIKQGSLFQQQGFFLDARTSYTNAYQLALESEDIHHQAVAQTALGYSEYLLNNPQQALDLLQHSLDYSKQNHKPELQVMIQYYLGLVHQSQNNPVIAKAFLNQSLEHSEIVSDPLLVSRIQLALAQSADNQEQLYAHHQLALQSLKNVTEANITGELYLLLAEQALDHSLFLKLDINSENKQANKHLAYLYQLLQFAKQNLDSTNNRQLAKYASLKARLYESQQRYSEALQLTQQAIQQLQTDKVPDLLLFYQWQAGRLYKALEKNQLALESYRHAISYVQELRQDIPITYLNGKSSFLELFGPLYRGMMELLLQQASEIKDQSEKTALLREVQGLMERLKKTELEDFFKDRCLLTEVNNNQLVINEPHLAILYPVVLPDRIELLLSIGEDFYQHTVPVSSTVFENKVRNYSSQLRNGVEDRSNRQLYDWLVRPISKLLIEHQIETLVYIPDGSLRLLPLASLHDGKRYLIENFAVSTLPALSLLPDISSLSTHQPDQQLNQTLLVGLSEPSPETVSELPAKLIKELFANEESSASSERSITTSGSQRSVLKKLRSLSTQNIDLTRQIRLEKIAEALSLPGVEKEIDMLSQSLPNITILNKDYTLEKFDQLAALPTYSIIHIASHGFFGGSSDESFIMTYDHLLTIDHLENLLTKRSKETPIDLLVLSACQTAEGDDRAPLGLSGVALKARARTALGSLWPISDEATVEIMRHFYAGFTQQGLSKAKALQQAQIKLIKTPEHKHPFFWSPFVLVGHWK